MENNIDINVQALMAKLEDALDALHIAHCEVERAESAVCDIAEVCIKHFDLHKLQMESPVLGWIDVFRTQQQTQQEGGVPWS